ncbi:dihydrolipoyl dehydrogenase [Pseudohongiella sp.]|uniref:Dihydrolipoyl dehydrogenase n=1 Tax=marine sediment metagenome TaxID=412755 RepID=A0A0F9W3C9_9ZZZZ|nr:dihydrolipoyl dehydrogenase [Pseudohongiella sp.]HDZ08349.1 dihydrolipoyl dehydrogenase [Pseudohongiella sp.]HEA61930.1 dihydrolipoyl dehydrogenase [Pseudohongiella sp.]
MNVDTVIVGAGTAGLSALREVRRYTDDFLVVNNGHWGTTCAAVGCMPSKALIEVANAFHHRKLFQQFGLRGADALRVDIPAVLAHVRKLRDGFVKGPESVPEELGKRAVQGFARLSGPGCIEVNGNRIHARSIILAPGSRPVVPESWLAFGDRILTTDSLFEKNDLPQRIAVVGMGAIGVEIAQALARLGITVAAFDNSDRLAGIGDDEVLAAFRPLLERELTLHLGGSADLEQAGDRIRVSGAGGGFEADAVLAAMGRRPNIDGLGLETLGVPLSDKGMPQVDPTTLRIGGLQVFLVGDANADRPLLHEAADEGYIASQFAAPGADRHGFCRRTPMSVVFSSPQVAHVGQAVSDISDQHRVTGSADFSRQGRVRITGMAAGVLRIHADAQNGKLLGADMCIPDAEHLAHLLALAIEQNMTVQQMLAMPFYHPVMEEGLRSALRDLTKQLPDKGLSDLSRCPEIGHEALD